MSGMKFMSKIKDVFGYTKFRTEADALFSLARKRECSEYDLFVQAAERWNIAAVFVSRDFKKYLQTLEVPHYVRDFVRSEYDEEADQEDVNEIVAALFRWLDRRANRRKQGK